MLKDTSSKDIERYINSSLSNVSEATIARKLSSLRKFFDWMKETNGLEVNPVEEFVNKVNILRPSQSDKEIKDKSLTRSVMGVKPGYSTLQRRILARFSEKPRLQKTLHSIFYSRPDWYKRYHAYTFTRYLHLAILIIFAAGLGYGVYDQFFVKTGLTEAYPTALTRPNRYLSFQGRLTNQYNTPITTATNVVFKLHDAVSAGNQLWTSSTCSVTPDQDGIFNVLLGTTSGPGYTCGTASELTSDIFSENAEVWLSVQVGADSEATPRIQIATVAYALNSETLQGFPAGTGASTIPYIDSTGKIAIAIANPTIESTSGTFAITGQAITISTPDTSDGTITINPDGSGTLNLTFEGTTPGGSAGGFVNATNANITSGSLYYGAVASNATGYNLIELESGSTLSTKFSVDAEGDTYIAGNLGIGTTSPLGRLGIGTSSQFNVEASGNITRIRNVTYSWPASQGGSNTYLQNDSSGNLTWATVSGTIGGGGTLNYIPKFTPDGSTLGDSLLFDNGTSVGIGTSLPHASTKLGLAGNMAIGATYGLLQAPTSGLIVEGNMGIGTTLPTQRLHISGNARLTGSLYDANNEAGTSNQILSSTGTGTDWIDISSIGISGTGTTNYISKWSSSTSLTNSLLYDNGTSVGIGTSLPHASTKLGLAGNMAIGATYGLLQAPTNGLIVEGGVGIGTTFNGSYKLNVNGTSYLGNTVTIKGASEGSLASPVSMLLFSSYLGNLPLGIYDIGGGGILLQGQNQITVRSQDAGDVGLRVRGSASATQTANLLELQKDASTTVAVFTADGNLGLGTISPQNRLDVEGGAAIGATYSGTSVTPTNGLIVEGNVGIGITNPTTKLAVLTNNSTNAFLLGDLNSTVDNDKTVDITAALPGVAYNALRINAASINFGVGTGVGKKIVFDYYGNVGIGTTLPTQKLHISGNARLEGALYDANNEAGTSNQILSSTGTGTDWIDISSIGISGTGTTNYVSKWGSSTSLTNSLLYDNGTSVGIGTTNPSATLDVNGNFETAYGNLSIFSSGNNPYISTASGKNLRLTTGGSTTNGILINTSDNVGIGTTMPSAKLDLLSSGQAFKATATQAGTVAEFNISEYSNSLRIYDIDTAGMHITSAASRALILETDNGNVQNLYLDHWSGGKVGVGGYPNSTSKLQVFGAMSVGTYAGTSNAPDNGLIISGNVGIGVTNPSQKLHISGNIRLTGALYDANNEAGTSSQILSSTGTGTDWIDISSIGVSGTGLANYVSKWNSSTSLTNSLIYDNGTNVGIGTATPAAKFHVYRQTSDLFPGIMTYNYTVDGSATTALFTSASSREYFPNIVGTSNLNLDIPSLATYGSVGVVGAAGSATGGRVHVGVYGYGYINDILSGNSGNQAIGGKFMSKITSAVTDFNGTVSGVVASVDTSAGTSTGGSVFGVRSTAIGDTNNTVYGGHFSGTGGSVNYGIYSSAGTNYFNDNVGIGTTLPKNKLDVTGSLGVGTTTWLATAPANGMLVQGNVGIGTTNTLSNLSVGSAGGSVNIGTPGNSSGNTLQINNFRFYNDVVGSSAQLSLTNQTSGTYYIANIPNSNDRGLILYPTALTDYTSGGLLLSTGRSIANSSAIQVNTAMNISNNTSNISGLGISSTLNFDPTNNLIGSTYNGVRVNQSFSPNAATKDINYNGFSFESTINQTTGTSAVTRGIYINPTLTSAPNFRAIEIVNNSGYGIYQSGASAVNYFEGNVGIGTSTPTQKLHISGSARLEGALYDANNEAGTSSQILSSTGTGTDWIDISSIGISGTGTTNYISKWGSSTSLTNSLLYDNGTSIGIGTTAPNSGNKLAIAGGVGIGSTIFTEYASAPANGMIVEGNVGIGTTSPTSSLHISKVASINPPDTVFGLDSSNYVVKVEDPSPSYGSERILSLGGVVGGTYRTAGAIVGKFWGGVNFNSGRLGFITSNSGIDEVRMVITETGNVGIGTTTPLDKLDVAGTGRFTGNLEVTTGGITVTGNSTITGTLTGLTGLTSSGTITFSGLTASRGVFTTTGGQLTSSGTSQYLIDSISDETGSGSLVFGTTPVFTTNITTPLVIGGTTASSSLLLRSTLGAGTSDYIAFQVGNNGAVEAGRITTGGNLGLGTTAPTQKLHISGNARLTGALYDANNEAGTSGQILSSTATGTDWIDTSSIGIAGTGTTNYLPKWSGTASLTNSLLYDNGTSVGIGTSLPHASTKLGLAGNMAIGATYGLLQAPTSGLIVEGNVGIGTSLPSRKLQVAGSVSLGDATARALYLHDGANKYGIGIRNTALAVQLFSATDIAFSTISSGDAFDTTANDKMVIKNDGNVGIGTSLPVNKLDIEGGSAIGSSYSGSITAPANGLIVQGSVGIGASAPVYSLDVITTSGARVNNTSASGYTYNIVNAGASSGGIYTYGESHATLPGLTEFYSGSGATGGLRLRTGTAAPIIFSPQGVERIRILSNGNTGIGTSLPTQQLHISGNARLEGALYDVNNSAGTSNQILSSTGTGTDWIDISSIGISGTGTTNYLPKWNSSTSLTNSLLYDNGTSVGIGTSLPHASTKLGLAGNMAIGSGYATLQAPTNGLIVQGQLGIGVTAPFGALANTAGNILDGNSAGVTATSIAWSADTDASYTTAIENTNSGSTTRGLLVKIGDTGDSSRIFTANSGGTDRFVINGAGNIGVGTTNVANKLDIEGGAAIGATYSGTSAAPANGLIVEGNVGIGTTLPIAKLHTSGGNIVMEYPNSPTVDILFKTDDTVPVNGAFDASKITGGFSGNGLWVNGYVAFSTHHTESATLNESLRITAGNVGISTTSPTQRLHLSGNMRLTGALYDANNEAGTSGQILSSTATGTDWIDTSSIGIAGTGTTNYLPKWSGTASLTNSLFYDNGTNVGIGTTTPSYRFSVVKSADTDHISLVPDTYPGIRFSGSPIIFQTTDTDTSTQIRVDGNGTGYGSVKVTDQDKNEELIMYVSNGQGYLNTSGVAPGALQLQFGGVNNLALFAGSGAGVNRYAYLYGYDSGAAAAKYGRFSVDSAGDFNIEAESGENLSLQAGGSDRIYILSNGNVGIGTTTPNASLSVQRTTAGTAGIIQSTYDAPGGNGLYVANSRPVADAFIAQFENTYNIGSGLYILGSSNVGIGTTNPSQKLHISGNARLTGALYDANNEAGTSNQILSSTGTGTDWIDISSIGVAGTGTPNYISKWGSSTSLTNSLLYDNGSNVGIGTTAPIANFTVAGSTTSYLAQLLQSGTGGGDGLKIDVADGNASNYALFVETGAGNTPALVVENLGRVGIGTTKPQNALDVEGGTAIGATYSGTSVAPTNGLIVEGNVGIGLTAPTQRLEVNGVRAKINNIYLGEIGSNYDTVQALSSAGLRLTSNGIAVTIENSSGEALRANGLNIGIGVTAPTQRLHVDGNLRLTGALYDANNQAGTSNQILSSTGTGTDWIDISSIGISGTGTTNYISKWSGTTSLTNSLLYDNGTSVGIGTTAPNASTKLAISGGVGIGSTAFTESVGAPANGLIVEGNVGIGVNAPSTRKLYVVGESRFDGNTIVDTDTGTNGFYISRLGNTTSEYVKSWVSDNHAYFLHEQDEDAGSQGGFVFQMDNDGTQTPYFLVEQKSGTDIFRVDTSSSYYSFINTGYNFGINTQTPQNTLDVEGGAAIGATYSGTSVAPTNGLIVQGNVGIGTTIPATNLSLGSSLNNTKLALYDSAGTLYGFGVQAFQFRMHLGASNGRFSFLDSPSGNELFTISGTGNVGIGITNPSQRLHVSGNLRLTGALYDANNEAGTSNQILSSTGTGTDWIDISSIGISGTGTINYLPKWNSSTSLVDSLLFDNGSNVGIGTAAPAKRLDVQGGDLNVGGQDIYLNNVQRISDSISSGYTAIRPQSANLAIFDSANNINVRVYNNNATKALRLYQDDNAAQVMSENTSILALQPIGGNVGIGTTNPLQNRLDIIGTLGVGTTAWLKPAPTNGALIQGRVGIGGTDMSASAHTMVVYTPSGSSSGIQVKYGDSPNFRISLDADNTTGGTLSTTSTMRLLAGGSLNQYTYGGTYSSNFALTTSNNLNGTSNQDLVDVYTTWAPTSGSGNFVGLNIYPTINQTGTATGRYTALKVNVTETAVLNAVNYLADFQTGGSSKLVITGAGNVGIGVTSPTQKLHISGNARLTGALYDANNEAGTSGQILSSTATGTDWIDTSSIGISGTGTTNYISKWSGSSSLTNSLLYDNGTSIGIGTTAPLFPIHVVRNANNSTDIEVRNTTDGTFAQAGFQATVDDGTSNSALLMIATAPSYTGIANSADAAVISSGALLSNGLILNSNAGGTKFRIGNADKMYLDANGNIGIGTTMQTQRLHISGNLRLTGALYDANNEAGTSGQILSSTATGTDWIDTSSIGISGTGTTNYISKWSGTASLTNSVIYDNGTYVGIGTSIPLSKLHINGGTGSLATGLSFGDGDSGFYEFADDGVVISAGGAKWVASGDYFRAYGGDAGLRNTTSTSTTPNVLPDYIDSDTGLGTAADNILSLIAGGANVMNITNANVGIGITAPLTALHVAPSTTEGTPTLDTRYKLILQNNASSGAHNGLSIIAGSAGASVIGFGDSGNDDQGMIYYDHSLNSLSFAVNGTPNRMTINSVGNLGIGTSLPTQRLHVDGNFRLTGALYDSNNEAGTSGQVLSSTATGTDWIDATASSGGWVDDGSVVRLSTSGDLVGIGTTSPSSKVGILGNLAIGTQSFSDAAAPTSGLVVEGNIGIGITNPSQKLHVAGSQRIRNAADANILLSATGANNSHIASYNDAFDSFTNLRLYGNNVLLNPDGGNNVGIGTTAPISKFDMYGTNNFAYLGGVYNGRTIKIGVDSTGTNTIQGILRTDGSVRDITLQGGGGNIGIGATTPLAELDVRGQALFWNKQLYGSAPEVVQSRNAAEFLVSASSLVTIGENSAGDANPALTMYRTTAGSRIGTAMRLYVPNSLGNLQFQQGSSDTIYGSETYTTVMALNNGKVGIGTTSPSTQLEVLYSMMVRDTSSNSIAIYPGPTSIIQSSQWGGEVNLRTVQSGGTINDGQIYMDSTGNVGIGMTLDPKGKLDVASGGLSLVLGADNNTITRTDATAKYANIGNYHYTNSEEPLALIGGSSTSGGGNVFIGGGTSLENSATNISFYTAANNTTLTGTEQMRINQAGNIGIGTTNPTRRLEVNGDVRINSTYGLYLYGGAIYDTNGTLTISLDADEDLTFAGDTTTTGITYFNGTTYYINASGVGNLNTLTLAGTGTALTISGAATTGINLSNTGITTDINLQNGETIDNDTDGFIELSGDLITAGGDIYLGIGTTGGDVHLYNNASGFIVDAGGGTVDADFLVYEDDIYTGGIYLGYNSGDAMITSYTADENITIDPNGVGLIYLTGSTYLTGSLYDAADATVNIAEGLAVAGAVSIDVASGTALTISSTSVGTDIVLQNDESIDNDSNGYIDLNGNIRVYGYVAGTAIGISTTMVTTDLSLQNGESIDNDTNGYIDINGSIRVTGSIADNADTIVNIIDQLSIDTGSNTAGLRLLGLAETAEIADIYVGDGGQLVFSTTASADSYSFFDFMGEDDQYGIILRDSGDGNSTVFSNFYMFDGGTANTADAADVLMIGVQDAWSTTPTGNIFVTNGGNIGIGTTNPNLTNYNAMLVVDGILRTDIFTTNGTWGICHDTNGAQDRGRLEDCNGSPSDLAEYYPGEADQEPGDLVVLAQDGNSHKAVKSSTPYDQRVFGIVSTLPTGPNGEPMSGDEAALGMTNPQAIGLSGKVPIKVSLENGVIRPGDYLTTSSTPGVAMKATKASKVVGIAIEGYDGTTSVTPSVRLQEELRVVQNRNINATPTDPPAGVGKVLAFTNLTYYDPDLARLDDTGEVAIVKENSQYKTIDGQNGNTEVTRVGVFSDLISGNIRVGLVNTKELLVESLATIGELTVNGAFRTTDAIVNGTLSASNAAISGLANVGGLIVNGSATIAQTLTATTVEATDITTQGFLAFQGTIDNLLVTTGLVSPSVNIGIISPLAENTDITVQVGNNGEDGKLSIENEVGLEVASIDSAGDATFAGTLESDEVKTNDIVATKIYADEIIVRNGKFAEIDTEQITGITRERIEEILQTAEAEQRLLADALDWETNTATQSASLAEVSAGQLYVTGSAAINNLSVSESLSLGTDLAIQSTIDSATGMAVNTIDSLSAPLRIQSLALAPVEIMAGLVKINTNGDVEINGNLFVAGNVESSGLAVKEDEVKTQEGKLLSLQDLAGSEVASINASGSAQFNTVSSEKLVIAGADIATPSANAFGEIETNATAGKAVLPANESEITIRNQNVSDYTLIYVTPTSTTNNNVLFVKAKGNGFFTVGFNNPISTDVEFNWWIIEVAR